MKRLFNLIVGLLIFIPFLNINALSCYNSVIDTEEVYNFSCSDVKGESFTFVDNSTGDNLSKYFEFKIEEDKATVNIIDKTIKFNSAKEIGVVKISDGEGETVIQIKNNAYVAPTTTTTTTVATTTKSINTKTLIVTLDPNNGSEVTKKECVLTGENTTCSVTLPKIDKETFSGWGTANTCKEGKEGTIRVDKDVTYYACYTDNKNQTSTTDTTTDDVLLLKSLSLKDKDTTEAIDFGMFSIKKKEYSFKVLNSVNNIEVNAEAEENVTVTVTGNENLAVGENKIVIKLVDKDKNETEYVLNVEKLKEGETINDVHFLKSLVIGGYNINFNKEQFVYNLTIPSNIDKLVINPVAENVEDIIEIKNNDNLVDGSTILINVTKDGDEPTIYSINITKESSFNYLLIGGLVFIVVLIIILIILIIIKSNKGKGNNKNNNVKSNDKIEVLNL